MKYFHRKVTSVRLMKAHCTHSSNWHEVG